MAPLQPAERHPEWIEGDPHLLGERSGGVSGLAITSLVMGILGLLCFPGVGGVAAIAFGIAARNDIAASRGTRTGTGLAVTGIITGVASVALTVLGLGALATLAGRPPPGPAHRTSHPLASPVPPATPRAVPSVPSSPAPTFHDGVRTARVGRIVLVDLGPGVVSLGAELDTQRERANQERRKLLLWLSQDDCKPCNGVAAALADPQMQEALSPTLVLRINARDYRTDLEQHGIPTQFLPGFALLNAENRPVDYLHGGEWDADIAENIAPVLNGFVRGTYARRRHPWHLLPAPHATPI